MPKIVLFLIAIILANNCDAQSKNSIVVNNANIEWDYSEESTDFNITSSLASGIDPGIILIFLIIRVQ